MKKKLLDFSNENMETEVNAPKDEEVFNSADDGNVDDALYNEAMEAIEMLEETKERLEALNEEQKANIDLLETGEENPNATLDIRAGDTDEIIADEVMETMTQESYRIENIAGKLSLPSGESLINRFTVNKKHSMSKVHEVSKESLVLTDKERKNEYIKLYKNSAESIGEVIGNVGKAIWEAIKKAFAMLKDFIFSVFNKIKKLPDLVKVLKGKTNTLSNLTLEDFFQRESTAGYIPIYALVLSQDTSRTVMDLNNLSNIISTILIRIKGRLEAPDKELLDYMDEYIKLATEKKINTDLGRELFPYVENEDSFNEDSYLYFGEKDKIISVCIGQEKGFSTSKVEYHKRKHVLGIQNSKVVRNSDEDALEFFDEITIKVSVGTIPLEGKVKNLLEGYLKSRYKSVKDLADDFLKEISYNMKEYMRSLTEIKDFEKTSKEVLNNINDVVKSEMDPDLFRKTQIGINKMSRDFVSLSKTVTRLLVNVTSGVSALGSLTATSGRIPG